MLERIENTISRYSMIPAGIRLGVAVSGGADSVFLLHFLAARGGAALTVLHVNHGLRGEESEKDCAFVRDLAEQMGLPFVVHRAGAVSGNLEQFCRRERMAFFASVMTDGLVERVATGHTASDQAETVLMRLLRGAGTTGLRGVLPVTGEGLVRPLLAVRREEVRDWLRERGLAWREDASNDSDAFLRNRVRARLLPVMRELAPEVDGALARVAELAGLDEDYWRKEAGVALDRCARQDGPALVIDRRGLATMHPALLLRVMRMALERVFGGLRRLDLAHVERVAELAVGASGEGTVEVPGGRAVRSMDWMRIEAGAARTGDVDLALPVPGEGIMGGKLVRIWLEADGGYTEGEPTSLEWERLRPPLRLRTWRAGDRFRPVGETVERPVKELFAGSRVPSWERHLWPMITDSDGIVWMYRFGAAASAAADSGSRIRLRVLCDTVFSK
ncbi:MAG: tRNA lysidine(34) synthetase TilS [Acidobacteria bacterium]|nr:tRNA lysidine(34) synthetase TilS [Acidobacteriota bacterium]